MHFKVTREGGAYCFTSCRKESTQLSPGGITSLLLAEDGEVVCACVHFQTCVFTRPDVYRRLMMSRIFKRKDSAYADPHFLKAFLKGNAGVYGQYKSTRR